MSGGGITPAAPLVEGDGTDKADVFMFHLGNYTARVLFLSGHIVEWSWPPLAYHHFTIAKGTSSSVFLIFPECRDLLRRSRGVGCVCPVCAGIADAQGQATGTQTFGTGRLEGKHLASPWLCGSFMQLPDAGVERHEACQKCSEEVVMGLSCGQFITIGLLLDRGGPWWTTGTEITLCHDVFWTSDSGLLRGKW